MKRPALPLAFDALSFPRNPLPDQSPAAMRHGSGVLWRRFTLRDSSLYQPRRLNKVFGGYSQSQSDRRGRRGGSSGGCPRLYAGRPVFGTQGRGLYRRSAKHPAGETPPAGAKSKKSD